MRCRWHKDASVPGGKFLVPGCWSRAINGDDAPCHCPKVPSRELPDRAVRLIDQLAACDLTMSQINAATDYLKAHHRAKNP